MPAYYVVQPVPYEHLRSVQDAEHTILYTASYGVCMVAEMYAKLAISMFSWESCVVDDDAGYLSDAPIKIIECCTDMKDDSAVWHMLLRVSDSQPDYRVVIMHW